ncbi:MAG: pyrroloquinoline quinone biosynthesis protein PqqB [Betaproteobacteria bacterium]|nr:pyrroloquinoline quinone biosynthesis protein PqqB [Betaproteobacteria bacterium]
MKIHVLGSAAGGGFPQWNCNCPQCSAVRAGSAHHVARTQSSIAVCANDTDWLLVNASPDVLQQIKAFPALQPARALRDTGIAAVLLMDAQIDHTTGLLMLREHRQKLPLYCHPLVREDLSTGNPLFKVLSHYCGIDWHDLHLQTPFDVPGLHGLQFEALPLISNAPPYSPHRDKPQPGDNVGLKVRDEQTGKTLFYAPGLGQMEPHVWQAMQSADCVMVDGTLWTDDEMIALGASKKTSRAMGHMPQSGADGMIEWLDKLPSHVRKILIHINNTNPILDDSSPQRQTLKSHGIEVAFDGMEITL